MAISKTLRFEILRRDAFTCRYCGGKAPEVNLQVDHVTPVAIGGEDSPENLATACVDCNVGKGTTPLDAPKVAEAARLADEWAATIASVVRDREVRLQEDREADLRFDDMWREWFKVDGEGELPRPHDWPRTIRQYRANGLTDLMLREAVETSMHKPLRAADDTWTYFCGVCWGMVRDLQQVARERMEEAVT